MFGDVLIEAHGVAGIVRLAVAEKDAVHGEALLPVKLFDGEGLFAEAVGGAPEGADLVAEGGGGDAGAEVVATFGVKIEEAFVGVVFAAEKAPVTEEVEVA